MAFQVIASDAALPPEADDLLHRFLAYWRSRGAPDRLPRRRDLDPMDIVPLLTSIFLLDVDGEDFRFSLVGEDVINRYGPLKGRRLGEIMSGAERDRTLVEHRHCIAAGLPVYVENTTRTATSGDWHVYQRLIAPLVSEDGRVTSLAGIVVFPPSRDRRL